MTCVPLIDAAAYDRTIAASAARIWENVLDWEHLPWLHRSSFAAVRLVEESTTGWRAWIGTWLSRPVESLVEVRIDRPGLRYLTRTADGEGVGTEIATTLEPAGERVTRVHVAFALPEEDPQRAAAIGAAYVRLYKRLWDEDEAMMVRRQALLDEDGRRLPHERSVPRSVPLGNVTELRTRLPYVVRVDGRDIRLVDVDGTIAAPPTVCPHRGGPLADAVVEDGCITCPWHGYRYDLRSGACVSGQPMRLALPRVDVDAARAEAALVW
jgi:nitrite reductase/ring-hydroxylating ferredoxin subunit